MCTVVSGIVLLQECLLVCWGVRQGRNNVSSVYKLYISASWKLCLNQEQKDLEKSHKIPEGATSKEHMQFHVKKLFYIL